MTDVEKLSDAELRTRLLEFGFPVMPITGTTRKVMVKKLKMLTENRKKAAAQDRRSLARYSSEEDSDRDPVPDSKPTRKSRRATMAAPPPPAAPRKPPTPRKDSDEESENSVTTTREIKVVTTSRTRNVVKPADEFDTGSESESELNRSAGFGSANSGLSSSYRSAFERKDAGFGGVSPRAGVTTGGFSPGRFTSYAVSSSVDAADKLNQIRSRLSLGSTSYDRPLFSEKTESSGDTPFLSNFTKRLSQISAGNSPRNDYDYKNDIIKEHDTNGGGYSRSYLSRPLRQRDLVSREFRARQANNILKNNLVSFAVLGVAFLFFVVIAIMYMGIRNESSAIDTSGYIIPYCSAEIKWKRGLDCLLDNEVIDALNMQKVMHPELHKRAVAAKCSGAGGKPHMTETEVIQFVHENYGVKDENEIKKQLSNFELLILKNPAWGISVTASVDPDSYIGIEDVLENMEEIITARHSKTVSLAVLHPDLPLKCSIYNKLSMLFNILLFSTSAFFILYFANYALKYYRYHEEKRKEELFLIVERIVDVLQSNAAGEDGGGFMVINHVRDMILPLNERKRMEGTWKRAVKFINENESRVRTEVQVVQGEPYEVWRWLGGPGLNTSGSPRTKSWQGQAFETQVGSVNSLPCSPTPCLKVRGMIDEGDRSFHTIREAVLAKCAHQCRILHCAVEPNSKCVYLKCADTSDAAVAYRNLHGWWYAGHLVTVKYLRLERYMQRFPDSPVSGPPFLKAISAAADWSN